MNKKIVYIGLDVDDQSFHGAALIPDSSELLEFKCRPNFKSAGNLGKEVPGIHT